MSYQIVSYQTKSYRTLVEVQEDSRERQLVYQALIVLVTAILLFLPLVATFGELLTTMVVRLGLDAFLRNWIVPVETGMMAALVQPLGISAFVTADTIHLFGDGRAVSVLIDWNCVGWQGLVLLVVSLIAGLQGPYTWLSKLESILVGTLGACAVIIFRLVSAALVAYFFEQLPAVIYHDYGGTVIILLWLLTFWVLACDVILEPTEGPMPVLGPKS